MIFFCPRITILVDEGTAVHSAAYLRHVAQEFATMHWLRVAMSTATPAVLFVGFLKFYRHKIASQDGVPGQQPGAAA